LCLYLQRTRWTQRVCSFESLVTTYVMTPEDRAEVILQSETNMTAQNVQILCSFIFLTLIYTSYWPFQSHYYYYYYHYHHHHHYYRHHISVMQLGHLLTRSGLTYPEVSSKFCHDSFCQLWNSVSFPWVIYTRHAFYLHVVSSFSCIPVNCLKLVLFLIRLQFVCLFCNLSGKKEHS
jgi:hypothetical protein